MLEKCHLAANQVEGLEVLNPETVSDVVAKFDKETLSRIIITDPSCRVIFDSSIKSLRSTRFVLFPEIIQALNGNDVFTWLYRNSTMQSKVAVPVYSYGQMTGCVYMMEYDNEQGALIASLQTNIFTITMALEAAIILFSLMFTTAYTGRLRRIMTSIRTVRSGHYSHAIKMNGHDELTALSNEFNDLVRRLQRSENKRRQFVSDASHELKTPLASIKLLSDSILQNNMDAATAREFMEDIGNEADRLNKMSQKLLNLARSEDPAEIDCEIVYIYPTIEKVVRMLSLLAQQNDVNIHVDRREDSTILMQEDDLYQILFNLVENGIKYNISGGSVHIQLLRQSDNAIIIISDSGVGIPPESLEHIFERFYRVDKARSRSTGGSGLGLSIVRSMVERNKGTIQVESIPGTGTTFTVTFPIFDMEGSTDEV